MHHDRQADVLAGSRYAGGAHETWLSLAPAYDEYTVAYQDRSAVLSSEVAARADSGHGIFYPAIGDRRQDRGHLVARAAEESVAITCRPFARLDRRQSQALAAAAQRYAQFLGLALARGRPSLPRGAPIDERRGRRRRSAMRGVHDE
jgi:hypothetical protein